MVCNLSKTEMMSFLAPGLSITMDGVDIAAGNSMKVLGVYFDDELRWEKQVDHALLKASRVLHGLHKIRAYLNTQQAKQVVTSFFFLVLFYALEVWYHQHLGFHLKRRVRSVHYKAMRLVYGRSLTRDELDCYRGNPDAMSNFNLAKQMCNIINSGLPSRLYGHLCGNLFFERRHPNRGLFYDDSVRKIGKQSLKNRLSNVSKCLKFDWLMQSKDYVRINLKKTFLPVPRPPA